MTCLLCLTFGVDGVSERVLGSCGSSYGRCLRFVAEAAAVSAGAPGPLRNLRECCGVGRVLLQRMYTTGKGPRRLPQDHQLRKCENRSVLRAEKVRKHSLLLAEQRHMSDTLVLSMVA